MRIIDGNFQLFLCRQIKIRNVTFLIIINIRNYYFRTVIPGKGNCLECSKVIKGTRLEFLTPNIHITIKIFLARKNDNAHT